MVMRVVGNGEESMNGISVTNEKDSAVITTLKRFHPEEEQTKLTYADVVKLSV